MNWIIKDQYILLHYKQQSSFQVTPLSAIAGQPGYRELYLRLFEKGQEFFQH